MNTLISTATMIVFAIVALVIHELAHIFAVNYLGGKVEKVGIFPLGLRARFRKLEKLHAWERYVIYGAGSAANILLAVWTLTVSHFSFFGIPWLEELAFINIILAVFNLLPIFPLDGGRIFHQFLSNRIGIRRANRVMLKLATWLGGVLIFLGFMQVILYNYNITLLCAAIYIRQQNKKIIPSLELEFFQCLEAKQKSSRMRLLPLRTIILHEEATIKCALDLITMDHFTVFCFEHNKIDIISEVDLLEQVFANGLQGMVAEIPNKNPMHLE